MSFTTELGNWRIRFYWTKMVRTAPTENQIEINLFGGGSSYGEAVLVHFGNHRWMVVDSVKDPNTKKPVILDYLEEIGENPDSIELILATHWHDDHIKGISDIYSASGSAFSISQALPKSYMARLVSLDEFKESSNSGLLEFGNVIRKSIEQKTPLVRAIQDRVLIENAEYDYNVKITALSPSDRSIEVFEQELGSILNDAYDLNLASRSNNPNHSSIVLLIEVGNSKILLGSDLEVTNDVGMGWQQVCQANATPVDNSVQIFKIPHHGSVNGHYDPVWQNILAENRISILTPYGRGRKKLPTQNYKNRIIRRSTQSYITSKNLALKKSKKRDPKVRKILKELSYTVKERKYEFGQIQLRRGINSESEADWEVSLFGNACDLLELNFNLD